MTADLAAATSVVELAEAVVLAGAKTLASLDGGADANQVLAYDLAHAAAAVATAHSLLEYGAKGDLEAKITNAFVADADGVSVTLTHDVVIDEEKALELLPVSTVEEAKRMIGENLKRNGSLTMNAVKRYLETAAIPASV